MRARVNISFVVDMDEEDVAAILLLIYASNKLNIKKKRKRKVWVKPDLTRMNTKSVYQLVLTKPLTYFVSLARFIESWILLKQKFRGHKFYFAVIGTENAKRLKKNFLNSAMFIIV